jgi:hypothetical protein
VRILTLDDMETRQRIFGIWYAGFEHYKAYTADEAKNLLVGDRFDLVCLDHDLTEEHYLTLSEGLSEEPTCDLCDHEKSAHWKFNEHGIRSLCERCDCSGYTRKKAEYAPGTGMDVVDHILQMPKEKQPKFVVCHSWNEGRREEMYTRLIKAGVPCLAKKFSPGEPYLLKFV